MPTSVSGTRKTETRLGAGPRTARGFTLLEILAVMVIIGLSVGVATVVFNRGGDDLLREEAEYFTLSTRFVAEQALFGGERAGLFITRSAGERAGRYRWCFRWQRHRDNSWQAFDEALEPRCLPPGTQVDIRVEGEPFDYDPEQTVEHPVMVIYPSGEATPFEIALYRDDRIDDAQRIEVDPMGQVNWRNRREETQGDNR